mmetsp:Transcript_47520/g.137265  ORF Transcript_47520/g.137265 Transcript_47520/m.137265 type:complete len:213 (+) Transcript_47520:586-1224(+)
MLVPCGRKGSCPFFAMFPAAWLRLPMVWLAVAVAAAEAAFVAEPAALPTACRASFDAMTFAMVCTQAAPVLAVDSAAFLTLPATSCLAMAWRPWLKPLSHAASATGFSCEAPSTQAASLEPLSVAAALLSTLPRRTSSAPKTSPTARQPTSAVEMATAAMASRELLRARRASSCTWPAAPYTRVTAAQAFLKSSGFVAFWAALTALPSNTLR